MHTDLPGQRAAASLLNKALSAFLHPGGSRVELAFRLCLQAGHLCPAWSQPYSVASGFLFRLGRFVDSEQGAQQALQLDPNDTTALCILARRAFDTNPAQAREYVDRAIASATPQGGVDAALQTLWIDSAIALGNLRKAKALIDAMPPDDGGAWAWDVLKAEFLIGREGVSQFSRLHTRFRARATATRLPSAPRWDGSPLNGRRLLVIVEGGLGDTVQFARFIPLLPQGTSVWCQRSLIPLLSRNMPGVEFFPDDAAPPAFDVVADMMSLPGLLRLGRDTGIPTQPYLTADPARVAGWKAALPTGKFHIGLVWAAGVRGAARCPTRSLPLQKFEPLAGVPGVSLVSLQRGEAAEVDLDTVGFAIDRPLTGKSDVEETAALMSALDLVVSVDSMPAHLAGALGVQTAVLLHRMADWRWGRIDSEETFWYPSARLLRQSQTCDWGPVLRGACEQINASVSPV